jgi:hypothetical protein
VLPVAGVALMALTLGSCSKVTGATKSSKPSTPAACTYVAKLDAIANTVANADVHDPDGFKKTLDTAVHDYVTDVRKLRAVAPAELSDGLERVEADVQQYRFDAALTDRAELDSYAARTCGRVPAAVSTTSAPGASVATTAPGSTTTTTAAAPAG